MKKIADAIDRFCILHPRFGMPNLMLYIVAANVLVYVIDAFSDAGLSQRLCFSLGAVALGQVWRIVTFVLIPDAGDPFSLLISCYFCYWIGSSLERRWGTAKFTCYYLGGVICTLLGAVIVSFIARLSVPLYGAGYVNFAMFLAFAAMWPDAQVLLFFIIPVKIKYLAYLDLAFFAWNILRFILSGVWYLSIIPLMALLNFAIFFWRDLRRVFGLSIAQGRQATRYRDAVSNVRREARSANAGLRVCAVCGRTNRTNPELDFRYCSRCAGYRCFCSEHIFSHVHFTDDASE